MEVTFWDIALSLLAAFTLAGILTLLAVGLGAFAVFRSKRESHEGLFQFTQPKGTVGSLDENFALAPPSDDPVTSAFKKLEEDNLRFLRQFEADKKGGNG